MMTGSRQSFKDQGSANLAKYEEGAPARSKKELLAEIERLKSRLDEAEEFQRAVRNGEVDALVVSGNQGDQVFTLQGADHAYRRLIETIL
jgi:hypothetical protein